MQPQTGTDRGRSRSGRVSRWFSPRAFLLALALSLLGVVAGGFVPFFGVVAQLVGLLFAGFVLGLYSPTRRYLEVALAAALIAGATVVAGALTSVFLPFAVRMVADYGLAIAAGGAGAGGLVGALGHYFGRDLRSGLTRDI